MKQACLFNEMTLMREIDRLHRLEVAPLLENRKLNWKHKLRILGKYGKLRCDAVSYRRGQIAANIVAEDLADLRTYIGGLSTNTSQGTRRRTS